MYSRTTIPYLVSGALVALFLALALGLLVGGSPAVATGGITERVSVASDGTEGNSISAFPAASADGRYVAFTSDATTIVPGDANFARDVFVRDRQTGATTRVSVDSAGNEANDWSFAAAISADGRYVAFGSVASNLVPGDTNGVNDVFFHDRETGATERVSVASDGTQGNGSSFAASISADGRYVAFASGATNLVPGSSSGQVFVHDRDTGETERVSVASTGTEGNAGSGNPSISGGRYVAFESSASNLVPGDTNSTADVFVHDRDTGETERVSVASDGTEAEGGLGSSLPSISADGRHVAFESWATNLVPGDTNFARTDVFVHDRETGATARVSVGSDSTQGNGSSHAPSVSAGGRYVAFESSATNLVPGDSNGAPDVFLHDRQTGETTRVSVASDGAQAEQIFYGSYAPAISADGRFVAFTSQATNLVPGDTNDALDVFVHDRQPASPKPTPTPLAGLAGDADCNGQVDAIDAALVLQFIAGLVASLPCDELADANGDGAVDSIDAALILQFVAGLVEDL